MDTYLEEELYDILTYCLQNPDASKLKNNGYLRLVKSFMPMEARTLWRICFIQLNLE